MTQMSDDESMKQRIMSLTDTNWRIFTPLQSHYMIASVAQYCTAFYMVGERLTVGQHTVGKWRRRFDAHRLDGLYDEPRPGGPRSISDEQVQQIVECTLHETPKVQNLL
jgi:hypothetical protein